MNAVFNPGAIEIGGRILLVARADGTLFIYHASSDAARYERIPPYR